MLVSRALNIFRFASINHIRGRSEYKPDDQVELRGIRVGSDLPDRPNMIFIPEIFDQAESWLQFFTDPNNKILEHRNVYILYPRNFGNSDKNQEISWQSHANDIARFMYSNKISMATLAGHGIGGKIALAAACYNHDKVTGYFGIDTTPTDQHFFEPYQELRKYIESLSSISLLRPFTSISYDIKEKVKDPKWKALIESNVAKNQNSYSWKFNMEAIWNNIKKNGPNSLLSWSSAVGLYPGRVHFAFPDESRYVYMGTNTLPMLKVCPHAKGFNNDIFSIQGDEGIQNHWVYERQDLINPYAWRMANFLKHYDGVHTLLQSREQVGQRYVPDNQQARYPRPIVADVRPAHYYHNWRFNNVYNELAHKRT